MGQKGESIFIAIFSGPVSTSCEKLSFWSGLEGLSQKIMHCILSRICRVSSDNDDVFFFLSGAQWSHKTYHRQRHPVPRPWDCWNQRQVHDWIKPSSFYGCPYADGASFKCDHTRAWYLTLVYPSFYSTTYITCPADPKKTLGIKLPFLVMIIKNLKKYFTFEVQVTAD